jgi:hypothetical protein
MDKRKFKLLLQKLPTREILLLRHACIAENQYSKDILASLLFISKINSQDNSKMVNSRNTAIEVNNWKIALIDLELNSRSSKSYSI